MTNNYRKYKNTYHITFNHCSQKCIIDMDDLNRVKEHGWVVTKMGYARSNRKKNKVLMHRLVLNYYGKKSIDHINGNKLDNRKSNLRICSQGENIQNAKTRKDNKSGFRGVSWHKQSKKWFAVISFNKKRFSLGYFGNKTDAAKVYNEKALELYGIHAKINMI